MYYIVMLYSLFQKKKKNKSTIKWWSNFGAKNRATLSRPRFLSPPRNRSSSLTSPKRRDCKIEITKRNRFSVFNAYESRIPNIFMRFHFEFGIIRYFVVVVRLREELPLPLLLLYVLLLLLDYIYCRITRTIEI